MSNGGSLPDLNDVVVEVRSLVLPRLTDAWIHDQYIGGSGTSVSGYIQPEDPGPSYPFNYPLLPGIAYSNARRIARTLLRDFQAWKDAQSARVQVIDLESFEGTASDLEDWLQGAEQEGWTLIQIVSVGETGTVAILRAPREIGEVPPL